MRHRTGREAGGGDGSCVRVPFQAFGILGVYTLCWKLKPPAALCTVFHHICLRKQWLWWGRQVDAGRRVRRVSGLDMGDPGRAEMGAGSGER